MPAAPDFGLVGFAERQSIDVARALLHDLGSEGPDLRDFRRRGDLGHEDPGLQAEPSCGVGHGRAVVAAGCSGHSRGRRAHRLQRVECAPGLEGAGMLKQFQLQRDGVREPKAPSGSASTGVRRTCGDIRP